MATRKKAKSKGKTVSCHDTKTAAKAARKRVSAKGMKSRVVKKKDSKGKVIKGYCVKTYGRKKSTK